MWIMWMRVLVALSVSVFMASLTSEPAAGQAPAPPRTPWGHPDLQGFWQAIDMAYTSWPPGKGGYGIVPFERPAEFGERRFLTEEEFLKSPRLAAHKKRESDIPDNNRELKGTSGLGSNWYDPSERPPSRRTSFVVDPPDGRVPPLTPEAQKQRDARKEAEAAQDARVNEGRSESWEDHGTWPRCITRTLPGAWIPRSYNNYRQILQTPDYVMIYFEMMHEARIIPLDGRPHLGGAIRGWMGDSRGRWEGDTLVIETTNLRERINFHGTPTHELEEPVSPDMRLIERLRRVDADTIELEYTIHDPKTWTKPWTVAMPLRKDDIHDQILEYGCHEDNRDIRLALTAGRAAKEREPKGK
jgi:hypothetical protein